MAKTLSPQPLSLAGRGANVPSLRFPEFTTPWQSLRLSEITVDGFNNGVFNDPKKVGQGYRLVNVKDMYTGDCIDPESLSLLDIDEKEFQKNKVEFGDIFFTRSSLVASGIAHCSVNLSDCDDMTYDGHLIRMRPDQEAFSPRFLLSLLKTDTARKQLVSRGKTTTMTTIGQEDIASVLITFPTPNEQQKIADFLTAVDIKIQQLKRKHSLMQQYKKGVMQQLFSQQVRFKDDDGRDYPDWEEKRLGDIAEIVTGKTPATSEKKLWEGNIPFVTPSDIQENYKFQNFTARAVAENGKFKFVPKGGIFYTCIASIGKMSIATETCITNQQINSLIVDECYENEFVYYFLLFITPRIVATQANTTLPIINKTDFSKFSILMPCLEEQREIADFLGAIDTKIQQLDTQITQAETFKKGLLQQMFV